MAPDIIYAAEAAAEGIGISIETVNKENEIYVTSVTYTIPGNYSGPVRINVINDIRNAAGSEAMHMPGDQEACAVRIINHSGKEYSYVRNSFIITAENNREAVYKRTVNSALQALLGFHSVSDSQMTDQSLDGRLKELRGDRGEALYPEGIRQLNQYYIDFYNKIYQTTAAKLEDFAGVYSSESDRLKGLDVLGGEILNGDGTDIKETDPEIIAASCDYFYNHILTVFPADQGEPALQGWDVYTVGQYMQNAMNGSDTAFEQSCLEKWSSVSGEGVYELPGFRFLRHRNYRGSFEIGFLLEETGRPTSEERKDAAGNYIGTPGAGNKSGSNLNGKEIPTGPALITIPDNLIPIGSAI